jgi:O-antigen/teichoic acid export membrane protein
MSRLKRIAHSVVSGYVVLAATAVYALASLPLALHYLGKERFGLWSLMASIGGYLNLIDLGMSGSVARLLIDHKDDRDGGAYGSLIITGWLVLFVQGALVLVVGICSAPFLSDLLKIDVDLRGEFILLMRWQSTVWAIGFWTRIFGHLLQAHQRIDITNYSSVVTLVLNFSALWVFFSLGEGVFSLAWATLLAAIASGLISSINCRRLGLLPKTGSWGKASWVLFREIFDYGKDMFLVAVGTQLIMASQTMIITRQLGLVASASWYAATRTFTLISQAVWRISDMSAPAFSEMIVRQELGLLRDRYRTVVIVSASASAVAAVAFAFCNSLFVTVYTTWTEHPIEWPIANDVLLGTWLIVLTVLHCHNAFVLLTKQIGFMRYIYFIEGIFFVTASLLTAKQGGLLAIIICSIVCSTLFSGAYGIWRASKYFELPIMEVGLHWMAPMSRVLLLFVPVAAATWWLTGALRGNALRLACHAILSGLAGTYFLLRFGISPSLQEELLRRAPKGISAFLRRILPGKVDQATFSEVI